jgi:uncharacterized repeat protein (TIGR03803 family)
MSKLNLWKTVLFLSVFWALGAIACSAQTFTTLANFDGTNGANPYLMSLVQGTDGNLYGTAYYGGANDGGTAFKITPGGTLTPIYSFCSKGTCADGEYPSAGLVLGTNGNFYGTTSYGGAHHEGTVFEITAAGKLTTIYSFCDESGCPDGEVPEGALVQATNGNFYGTTTYGGAHLFGTVFEITPTGTLRTLHSFDLKDGADPDAGLVQATNGNFYGTTFSGGANGDYGTVFEITPAGKLTTLYSFCSKGDCADGFYPYAGLVQASNGNFYGTTSYGGAHHGGTVFEITAAGKLTTIYSFCSKSGCADGYYPKAGLIQATDSNLYGTTYLGGARDYGTVFKITTAGTLTTRHSFVGDTHGYAPAGGVAQATNGNLYGTTYLGGTYDYYGTVFSLAVGLGPFVETNPTSGSVGTAVTILGNNLTGATSVTFNGIAATFKVVSSTEITTTVPKGATTGQVKVKTPSRTLTSDANFRVP